MATAAEPEFTAGLNTLADLVARLGGISLDRIRLHPFPGTASVQIIVNPFRLKPLEQVLPAAADAGVGVIARVPLASGLLSGKYTADTRFADDDRTSPAHAAGVKVLR